MNALARAAEIFRTEGAGAAISKTVRYPFKPLYVRGALRRLHTGADQAQTWPQLFGLLQGFNHHGIHIASWQRPTEIVGLLELMEQQPPRRVLEIGTARGGTLFMLAQAASDDATIISIDLPGGAFGGEVGYPRWRTKLYQGFGRPGQRMEILRADSHRTRTLAAVERLLGGAPLDLLFIDGDHTYAGVSLDWQMYGPLVREGGLIALHDIVPGGDGHGDPADVPAFWRDLKEVHPTAIELVQDWDWGSCGIGVIRSEGLGMRPGPARGVGHRPSVAAPPRSAS